MSAPQIVLHYNPQTRAAGVRMLLEELGAAYTLKPVNLQDPAQRSALAAINPMCKLPTIVDGETVVTEQVAIYIYLAERFPQKGLAPAIGDPLRGAFLRWMAFYGACFEPAVIDKYQKNTPAPRGMNPYADWDTMFDTVLGQLGKGPWMLGERFSAVDVLWGAALGWMTRFQLVPETPVIKDYVERFEARAAVKASREKDAAAA